MLRLAARPLSLLGLCLLLASSPAAPATRGAAVGQIAGTIRDEAGALVAGAADELLSAGGAELSRARTDAGGRFSFAGVAAASYAVERVEVVRGPNSTPYGSDSLGGTMNVLTRPAGADAGRFELHGGARAYFSSADLRWEPLGRRFWVETYSLFAGAQTRFSDNDLQQARIGGVRTRDEITQFFNNGAVARGLARGGVLLETGETLPQVLRRVLGYRFGEHTRLTFILENVFDKNYRTMGSGVDAPGTNAFVSLARNF